MDSVFHQQFQAVSFDLLQKKPAIGHNLVLRHKSGAGSADPNKM